MKDMDAAVDRLNDAMGHKERILVYGDYDVDGCTAVALVYKFLRQFYSNIDYYIPDRYDEGYGVSKKGIDFAKETGVKLIIILDCGIKAIEEITYALQELLAGGKSLPKRAIAEKLTSLGFLLDDRLLTSLLVRMEIEGLLCSGEMQGREATWALLSERVPIICSLTPDEALKQLALKYFRSHSPASLEDFVWWSGLTKTQCRKALALIAREIEEIKIEEEMMYLYHKTLDCPDYAKMVLLLPPYDEYLIGYKSRWVALEKKHTAKAHNNFGIFNPVILHEGRVVGNWKASIDKQAANLTIDFFDEKSKIGKRNLQGAVNQFVEFCKVTANRAS